jgi:ParB-like chromosome segregation protein Spo0J
LSAGGYQVVAPGSSKLDAVSSIANATSKLGSPLTSSPIPVEGVMANLLNWSSNDPGPIPQGLVDDAQARDRERKKHTEYKKHPITAKFPKIETEERQLLIASITEVGLLEPITLHEGMILDGRARHMICKAIQYEFKDSDFVTLPEGVDPIVFWLSKNAARTHWTAAQKQEVIRLVLERYPNHSSRMIAKMVGVSHPTVEKVRQEQATGKTFQSESDEEETDEEEAKEETRVGADGKARRKRKGSKKKGTVSARTLKKNIDDFIDVWPGLNENQKTTFVKAYQHELREILEWVEAEVEAEDQASEHEANATA